MKSLRENRFLPVHSYSHSQTENATHLSRICYRGLFWSRPGCWWGGTFESSSTKCKFHVWSFQLLSFSFHFSIEFAVRGHPLTRRGTFWCLSSAFRPFCEGETHFPWCHDQQFFTFGPLVFDSEVPHSSNNFFLFNFGLRSLCESAMLVPITTSSKDFCFLRWT